MIENLKNDFINSLTTILPVVFVVTVLSLFVPMGTANIISFLLSSVLLIIGSTLFTFGAELSMIVIGNKIGKDLIRSKKVWMILSVGLIIGTLVTIAEPDLIVFAEQLTTIPSFLLTIVVSLGVGICVMLAAARSLFGWDLNKLLIIGFGLIFVLSFFVPADFVAVAFDSGGVTTGTLSIPFIMTLGMGLVANRVDAKAKEDSFGLIALASTGPILMVLLLGLIYKPTGDSGVFVPIGDVSVSDYVVQFIASFKSVLFAILPIIVVFGIYQLLTKKVSSREMRKILLGIVVTIIGLTIFLVASNVGFINMGYYIGDYFATSNFKQMILPIIMILAFFIAIAEPAVMILIEQVVLFTEGSISKRVLKVALAMGVSIAAGLSIIRVYTGTPFIYYAAVGYGLAFLLMLFVPKMFTAIAFDAGGATGGALTTTFLLPIAMGTSYAIGGNPITDAFGLASMVSLVPIITVQIVGLIYQIKLRVITRFDNLDDTIIDYDWEVQHD